MLIVFSREIVSERDDEVKVKRFRGFKSFKIRKHTSKLEPDTVDETGVLTDEDKANNKFTEMHADEQLSLFDYIDMR